MKPNKLFLFAWIIYILMFLSACGAQSDGPQSWLDWPLHNSTAPLEPITIQTHASDNNGIAQIEFFINDSHLVTVDTGGDRLSNAVVEWTPSEPGVYKIDTRAIDTNGNPGSYATAVITIDGKSIFDSSVQITGVECAEGLAVDVDVNIIAPNGVESYSVFSTWVAAEVGETFKGSLPGNINKRVQLVEPYPDDMVRNHQIGLKVMIAGDSTPHYAYAFEPNNLCPGHYQAPDSTEPQCSLTQLVAPVLQTPADNNSVNTPVKFAWSGQPFSEIGCHPHSWRVDISENSNFSNTSFGFGTLDHQETNRDWPLPAGKCYYWRVLAYVPDNYGPPSAVRKFCIPAASPPVVTQPPVVTAPPVEPEPPLITDTTPPSFFSTGVSPDLILTKGNGCQNYERRVTVAAAISDESGLSSVVAYWHIGAAENGQVNLQEGELGYWATIGPVNTTGTLEVYITAQDTFGNLNQSDVMYVTVNNCIQ